MADVLTYHQDNYDGGLHDTAHPTEIKQNEASILRNWDITTAGQLSQRAGLTQLGGTINATGPITGMGAFIRNSGDDFLVTHDTDLYYLNSTTWTAISDNLTNTSGLHFWFENVQSLGKIYFGNEDNELTHWDRAGTTLNSCLTVLDEADVPHGNVYRWHKNHMFTLNNVNHNGTKYPNRVYWSNIGDPETWTHATNYFDVPGDGRVITANDLGDSLVIFKERSIQFLNGWGSSSWQITASASNVANLDERVGCVAKFGTTRVGNEVWFIDNEGQIRRIYQTDFDAFRRDIISTKIQATLNGVNKTQLEKAIAWTHGEKVYFAFPNESDTNNSLLCVFDILASKRTNEEAWTTYTGWTPEVVASYPTSTVPDMYIGDALTGKVFKVDPTADDDAGVAIDCNWTGKQDYYKKPYQYKWYRFGYARGIADTSGSVDVTYHASVDSAPFAQIGTLTLESGGSKLGPTGSFLLGPTGDATLGGNTQNEQIFYFTDGGGTPEGRSLRMSIRHNTLDEKPRVTTWSVHYKNRQIK